MTTVERTRLAAIACVAGGIGWFLSLMLVVAAHDAIYDHSLRYRVWEGVFVVIQLTLFLGFLGFVWSGVAALSRASRIGFGIVMLGRAAFVLGELRSFIDGKDEQVLIPLGAVLSTIGLLLLGGALARSGTWSGWRRYVPLAAGIYPLLAMFPIVAATGGPSNLAIAFWGLFWGAIGLVLLAESRPKRSAKPARPAAAYS